MIMTTTQKIIRIGSSKGVTLPARQLKELGVTIDDEVLITIKAIKKPEPQAEVMQAYKVFAKKYDQTLKNLNNR